MLELQKLTFCRADHALVALDCGWIPCNLEVVPSDVALGLLDLLSLVCSSGILESGRVTRFLDLADHLSKCGLAPDVCGELNVLENTLLVAFPHVWS